MADDADHAKNREDADLAAKERSIREAAQRIPVGSPGECDSCGEYFIRLVGGHCARCRDRLGLP